MLQEYFDLINQIDALQEKKDAIREKLIKRGTHASKDFICEVKEQTRRSISLTEIEKTAKEIAKALSEAGLIKETKLSIVKVSPKARSAA